MDSGVWEGDEILMYYDLMIVKFVIYGKNCDQVLDVQVEVLDWFYIEGIQDNMLFCVVVMDEKCFCFGNIMIVYIKDEFFDGFIGIVLIKYQIIMLIVIVVYVYGVIMCCVSQIIGCMLLIEVFCEDWVVVLGDDYVLVLFELGEGEVMIKIGKKLYFFVIDWVLGSLFVEGVLDGQVVVVKVVNQMEGYLVRYCGVCLYVLVCMLVVVEMYKCLFEKEKFDFFKLIIFLMFGLVVLVDVVVGQEVQEGEVVCIVEVMKMQNIICVEVIGIVKFINVDVGDSVVVDQIMVEFE